MIRRVDGKCLGVCNFWGYGGLSILDGDSDLVVFLLSSSVLKYQKWWDNNRIDFNPKTKLSFE